MKRGVLPLTEEFSRHLPKLARVAAPDCGRFVFPLTMKLMLSENNLYALSDQELGACDALDDLLDSNWGNGWRKPPE